MPALDQSPNPKPVDASLWFDSFPLLLNELEDVPLSSDIPASLADKLKENHGWFLDTLTRFKPPSQASREALNSPQITVGSQTLSVNSEFRGLALNLSSTAHLDEVQSYILVERFAHQKIGIVGTLLQERLHEIVLQYYIERQCLLKCIRHLIAQAVHIESEALGAKAIHNKVENLVSDGLECKLMSILNELLTVCTPVNMDVDLFVLWAEEMLIEVNLVLEILFLNYYESFSVCDSEKWMKLCLMYKGIISGSFNFGKLGVSPEALDYCYHAKVQMLLILMETLDLESLLQMIHDEIPFRERPNQFSLSNIQRMDVEISSFDVFETKEAGPLVLTWAVFLCLITSALGKEDNFEVMDVDHVGYVRQAFEAGSMSYFLEILQSDVLKDSDGPIAGCKSILRTFISAFVASYEINVQMEDNILQLILAILCEIYQGEESLCAQFWDKDSITDGPIRTLLFSLEVEFPYRTTELISLLSSLSEGTWPAECVNNDFLMDRVSQHAHTRSPLAIPGIEGLVIPSNTSGQIIRMVDKNTAIIRWQYKQSGLLVLLLRLTQKRDFDIDEEAHVILDLFSRLASFNMGVCFSLMNAGKVLHFSGAYEDSHDSNIWIDVVEVLCNLVRNASSNPKNLPVMSTGVGILAKISPSYASGIVLKKNIFDALQTSIFNLENNGFSSGTWILSGRLAKMMLIDFIDFTMQLLGAEVDHEFVLALYVFVNHECWKYKVKHDRWKVTLKVLELLKTSIMVIPHLSKIGDGITRIILSDSSIHNMLFRIICTTSQDLEKLYASRLFDLREIEGWQLAICLVLDILMKIITNIPVDDCSGPVIFHQAILSPNMRPMSVVISLTSLMSFFRNPAVQVGAARVLSLLCSITDRSESHTYASAKFSIGDKQIMQLRNSIESIIREKSIKDEDLLVATVNLLVSAALYQPAFFVGIISAKEITTVPASGGVGESDLTSSFKPLKSKEATLFIDALLLCIERSEDLISSNVRVLLSILNLLKALWQGSIQYDDLLVYIRKSEMLWKHLSGILSLVTCITAPSTRNLDASEAKSLAFKYQCQSTALDILALEMFLHKKLLHAETSAKEADRSVIASSGGIVSSNALESANLNHLKHIFSSWSDGTVMSDLVRFSSVSIYEIDIYNRAKMSSSLFAAHVLGKLSTGDAGSLSVSLTEKINTLSSKLYNQPAFAELLNQYSCRGYSEGMKLKPLILSDLYYHIQGELEGREVDSRPFKELYQVVADSDLMRTYKKKFGDDLYETDELKLYDIFHLKQDIGLDMWAFSDWKASEAVAETMLLCLQNFNSMLLLGSSRLLTIRALIMTLNIGDPREETTMLFKMPKDLILSSINQVCEALHSTVESLIEVSDFPQEVANFLAAETELLPSLIRHFNGSLPLSTCKLLLRVSGIALKALSQSRILPGKVECTMKFLLMLLLSVVESSYCNTALGGSTDIECIEDRSEVSNACLGLLPILCSCCGTSGQEILSLACVDAILKTFLTPQTWLPIIQKHLRLQHIILMLHDEKLIESFPVILKFLLTVAQVKGGAEMLLASGFSTSLRVIFSEEPENMISPLKQYEKPTLADEIEKPKNFWGLGLSVLTAMICSLGESSAGTDFVDKLTPYLFIEKGYLIAYHLMVPGFPSGEHVKKRARAQKTNTSLSSLRETEDTLLLLYVLARHKNSWVKATRSMDSQLRERIIHVLAFISKGNHNVGDLSSRTPPLICLPVSKEEFSSCKRAAFAGSKRGWFALSPHGSQAKSNYSAEPVKSMAIVLKDQADKSFSSLIQSQFSDTVAVQIYRIAFLALKFLCLDAKDAARRSEELGFIDLSRIPELPVPEILHGLQDQSISIVTELCEANKSKLSESAVQDICLLLLEITEMALHLELCVSQTCGIRPVSGRIEDFTKEIRLLIRATEGHAFLKTSVKQLKQVISYVYPGLLQSEGLLKHVRANELSPQ
ncbi:hypothetical protein V2J09_003143 [Rumex salicifolius]